jgi:hypothetical protein
VADFETFQPFLEATFRISIHTIIDYNAIIGREELIQILGTELYDKIYEGLGITINQKYELKELKEKPHNETC